MVYTERAPRRQQFHLAGTSYVTTMKWRDMVHVWMVYTEGGEMAAVSRGTSHVTIQQHCIYTTSVDIQKRAVKS